MSIWWSHLQYPSLIIPPMPTNEIYMLFSYILSLIIYLTHHSFWVLDFVKSFETDFHAYLLYLHYLHNRKDSPILLSSKLDIILPLLPNFCNFPVYSAFQTYPSPIIKSSYFSDFILPHSLNTFIWPVVGLPLSCLSDVASNFYKRLLIFSA